VRYGHLELNGFWDEAATAVPTVIVGGGRWGRVWAKVISHARGSSDGLALVTRHDPDDVRRWVNGIELLKAIHVAGSIDEALDAVPAHAAIIASRPRDHISDAIAALRHGAHVLVEKPIASAGEDAEPLLATARAADRLLAIGTEFAFLPALHQCAAALGSLDGRGTSLRLTWDDPAGEVRHGGKKAQHEEIGILDDLLPHALSVFRIFSERREFRLVDAWQNPERVAGRIGFTDASGTHYQLACNRHAEARKRVLQIDVGSAIATVDFTGDASSIVIDGHPHVIRPEFARLTSTLRLELGAFASEIAGKINGTPITRGIDEHVRLASELAARRY
jgi:predicted dehydrogenase